MKKFMAVFWEEKVVRKYFTVEAHSECEASEKFESEQDMTLDHEEFVERTDGGNCLEEFGITELMPEQAKIKPADPAPERVKINVRAREYITVHIGNWSYCFSYGIEVAKRNLKTEEKFIRRGDFYTTHEQSVHIKKFFGGSDNMVNLVHYSLGGG